MKVVTVVTDPDHKWLRGVLAPSCDHHGLELVVLVSDRPLADYKGGSYREKDRQLARYLATVSDDELVMFTDGYDALMLAGADEIEEKFARLGHPVLVSAESNLWPKVRWVLDTYPDVPGPAKYLNTGGMIGRAGELRSILARVEALPPDDRAPWSNQYRWITLYIQERQPFALDHENLIFFAAAPKVRPEDYAPWGELAAARGKPEFQRHICNQALARFEIDDQRIRLPHGARPCHLHFNGICSWPLRKDISPIAPLMPWR